MIFKYLHLVPYPQTSIDNMNALADYGTSSSSDTDGESDSEKPKEPTKPASGAKLPKPEFGSSQPVINNSVFTNPFVQAELAKSAILEKHVKMVPVKDQTHMINGKKICWSYRKGRCRFGHNCKYAHDSDIQKTPDELDAEKQGRNTVVCEVAGTQSSHPPPAVPPDDVRNTNDDRWEVEAKPKLKRPGLSQGIIPSKKVLKMYQQQKGNTFKK